MKGLIPDGFEVVNSDPGEGEDEDKSLFQFGGSHCAPQWSMQEQHHWVVLHCLGADFLSCINRLSKPVSVGGSVEKK